MNYKFLHSLRRHYPVQIIRVCSQPVVLRHPAFDSFTKIRFSAEADKHFIPSFRFQRFLLYLCIN